MNLTNKTKVSYGIGAVGKDMVYALVAGFLMYYYNDLLGINPGFIGTLFMAARIFDAFNDPLMGMVVNKTKSRFGKFRPWILTGTVLNALVLILMFNLPLITTADTLVLVASILYFLWGMTYTVMDIPFWSFIPSLSKTIKERESISVISRSAAGLGFAIITALALVFVNLLGNGNEIKGFGILSVIVAIIFIVSSVIVFFNVKEITKEETKDHSIKEMLQILFKNDQALVVVIAIIIFNSSLYLTQNLAIYFFKYDIGNADLFGVFATIGGAAQILSMMALPVLRHKFSRKQIFVYSLITTIIGYIGLFILGILKMNNIVLLSIMAIIIFIGFGLATVLTTIFLADCVDYGEYKLNNRSESIIFSMQTFVVKFASAISVFIAGWGLELINLDNTLEVQTNSTLMGLRILMIVIPIIGLIACIIYFLKKYILDDEYYNKIIDELSKR